MGFVSSTIRVELMLPLLIAHAITCWNLLAQNYKKRVHFDGLHIPHFLRSVLLSLWVLCYMTSTIRVGLMLPLLIAHAITCWNLLAQNYKTLVHFDGLHIPHLLRSVLLSLWVLYLMSSAIRVALTLTITYCNTITR